MAKKGLRAWVKENWVDIANPRSDGSFPCLLYTSPSPRDAHESRMPSSA